MRIGILEGTGFSPRALEKLADLGSTAIFDGKSLPIFLSDKNVLFVRLKYRIDATFLKDAPVLKILCSPTTGHTHLDKQALADKGVTVISLRGEDEFLKRIRATPEHTLGLMLALLRRYRKAFIDSTNRHWDRDMCRGDEIFGMRVGLIGMGRVGQIVAEYLRAMGACIAYIDPNTDELDPSYKQFHDIRELIEWSQLVCLCASYNDNDPIIIDKDNIKRLKNRYFVNTARGELVDEAALLEAVRNGALKGVATDVIANENGLNRLDEWLSIAGQHNVIVTPHIGGATSASMNATEEFVLEKLLRQLSKCGDMA